VLTEGCADAALAASVFHYGKYTVADLKRKNGRSGRAGAPTRMIIPCIDLMDGKVVQLVQGREKVLEGKSLDEMLEMFSGFPQIQVIDLDAALGRGSNGDLVAYLARHASIRAGGGVRTVERARELLRSRRLARYRRHRGIFSRWPQSCLFWRASAETIGLESVDHCAR
jgi:imidazole glycerol phosphate synthase subunit HisF